MKDIWSVSPTYPLDPAKLRRQRKHWREISAAEHATALSGLSCLGFDGKIDTRSILDKESYTQLEFIKEDHYIIASYPGNVYVDHVAPQTECSADITKELISVVKEKNSDKTLTAIVYDRTNINTGYKHGVIRSLEEQFLKPLQWLICLLHCNELPLRALIIKLDGDTSGPRGFKGPIGQQLSVDHKILKIADYPPLDAQPITFLDTTSKELSPDKKYLLIASNPVIFEKSKLDQKTCYDFCKDHLLEPYTTPDVDNC